jgi:hypothetical protein
MAVLAAFINSVVRASVLLTMALFFQVIELDNPMEAGLAVLPITVGMFIAAPLSGYLAIKFKRA